MSERLTPEQRAEVRHQWELYGAAIGHETLRRFVPQALDDLEALEAERNCYLSDLKKCNRQINEAEAERDSFRVQLEECRNAVRNQRGDDLCWIKDEAAAKALPRAEFLESCDRHRQQIARERGEFTGGRTIAQLEADNAALRARCEQLEGALRLAIEHCDGWRVFQADDTAVPFFPLYLETELRGALAASVLSTAPAALPRSIDAAIAGSSTISAKGSAESTPKA